MMRRSMTRVAALSAVLGIVYIVFPHTLPTRALFASQQPAPAVSAADTLSPAALAQIRTLFREKQMRTGDQLKIDSRLLVEMKRSYGDPISRGLPIAGGLSYTNDQRLLLDIQGTVTD